MEHTNRKKKLFIFLIVLIAILFVAGIVFSIVKDVYYDQVNTYHNLQSLNEDY